MNYGKVAYTKVSELEKNVNKLYNLQKDSAENTVVLSQNGILLTASNNQIDFDFVNNAKGAVLLQLTAVVGNLTVATEMKLLLDGVYLTGEQLNVQTCAICSLSASVPNLSGGVHTLTVEIDCETSVSVDSCNLSLTGSYVAKVGASQLFYFNYLQDYYGVVTGNSIKVYNTVDGEPTTYDFDNEIRQAQMSRLFNVLVLTYLELGELKTLLVPYDVTITHCNSVQKFAIVTQGDVVKLFVIVRNRLYSKTLHANNTPEETIAATNLQGGLKAVNLFSAVCNDYSVLVVESSSSTLIYKTTDNATYTLYATLPVTNVQSCIYTNGSLHLTTLKDRLARRYVVSLTDFNYSSNDVMYASAITQIDAQRFLYCEATEPEIYNLGG